MCQRYFVKNGSEDENNEGVGAAYSTGSIRTQRLSFPIFMRNKPTISLSNVEYYNSGWIGATAVSSNIAVDSFCADYSKSSSFTTGYCYPVQFGYEADAEL